MAYMGRGGFNLNSNNGGNNGHFNNDAKRKFNETAYIEDEAVVSGYKRGRYYVNIKIDSKFIAIEVIASLLIIFIIAIIAIFTYKSTIIDPIEKEKKVYLTSYLIVIASFFVINLLVRIFSKDENNLVNRLILVTLLSVVVMIMFISIKVYFDTNYTEDKFEQIYLEQNSNLDSKKTRISVSLTDMGIKSEEQYYVDECMHLYNVFKIKSYGVLGLHVFFNILMIWQISKIRKNIYAKAQAEADDSALFDDEEDVKY